MLYDRWRRLAHAHREKLALLDIASARRWTFGELLQAADQGPALEDPISFPHGGSPEFIVAVLRAWRDGRIVCPLEPGQNRPQILNSPHAGIVHLKMTSASTGKQRLVAFTAAQLAADAENIVETMGLRPEWPNLGVISLAHSYGFSNLVLPLLLHGVPLILVGSALPEAMRAAARSEESVTLAAVPALWQAWHGADCIPANLRLAISAGAPLPLPLEHSVFAARGLKIHNFYGSSECGGIAYDQSDAPRTDASYAGRPLKNVTITTAKEGCLEVRGAAVAETY